LSQQDVIQVLRIYHRHAQGHLETFDVDNLLLHGVLGGFWGCTWPKRLW